jgi:DNA-binding transcriptional MerR regulator
MFKIGEFSKICQVSIKALRHWDEIDLLHPAHVDESTNYRYYTTEQLSRVNRIIALRTLGLSLSQVKTMLDEEVSIEEIRGMLRLKQAQIEQKLQEEQLRLMLVESRLRQIEEEGELKQSDPELKSVPVQRVLSFREVTTTVNGMIPAMMKALKALEGEGLEHFQPSMAVFYDSAFKYEEIDWEFGYQVPSDFEGKARLEDGRLMRVNDLPPVEMMASIVHHGPWLNLHEGYCALGRWIEANNLRIAGPGREIFTKVDTLERPLNNITEIQFPVEAA